MSIETTAREYRLSQHITWHGRPAQIIGKTYGPERKYDLKTEHGGYYQDVPESQIKAVDNVVPIGKGAAK